jgi:alkanesulfonate monooxygenase SsuD/methylene tetrahydromethanopterin reductase-like flavin-dependent oxidoreductase (luciferase family)/GNAT superfamily N-acetyltransferase
LDKPLLGPNISVTVSGRVKAAVRSIEGVEETPQMGCPLGRPCRQLPEIEGSQCADCCTVCVVDKPQETELTLPSGLEVKLRPILPEDRDELPEGLKELSSENSFFRFLRVVSELTPRELSYLTEVDYWNHFACVAAVKEGDDWTSAGIARYVRTEEGGQVAEAAVTVLDAFRGNGLGSLLLQLLSETAAAQGIETFLAVVSSENSTMIKIFSRLGAEVHHEGSTTQILVDLPLENRRFDEMKLGRALKAIVADGTKMSAGVEASTSLLGGTRPLRSDRARTLDFKTTLQHIAWPDIAKFWVEADALGIFGTGWLNDHLYSPAFPGEGESSHSFDPFTALGALAAMTQHVRLGTLVLGNLLRHPAVVARMAVTLDHISGGRFELGVGAGWHEREHADHGIDLMTPGKRLDAFKEACVILDGLLSGETVTMNGEYYQLDHARLEPGPIAGSMSLTIGGSGEKRTLRIVAEHASHWNFDGLNLDDYFRKRGILEKHCAAVGRDYREIRQTVQLWVSSDIDDLVERTKRSYEEGADGVIFYFAKDTLGLLKSVHAGLQGAGLC